FAYFFAPFAKMESDRNNSQDRVAHASDLSTVLVPPGQALRPVSSSGGSGCASEQLKGLVAQKRDYIIIRESYARFFHRPRHSARTRVDFSLASFNSARFRTWTPRSFGRSRWTPRRGFPRCLTFRP